MKKLFVLLAAVAMLAAPSAQAQDKMIFNHLAVGASLGTNGLGIQVAVPATNWLQIRGGYSFWPFGFNVNVDMSSLAKTSRDLTDINVKLTPLKGGMGELMLDFFPSKTSNFHITAGAFLGGGNLLHATADLSKKFREDEYGTFAFGHGDVSFTSDEQGYAHIDILTNKFMPYLGIGFGRPIDLEHNFSVSFDFGVAYWGSPKVVSYNYMNHTLDPSKPVEQVPITSEVLQHKDQDILDFLGKFPVYPMLKVKLFFRLF